MQGKFPIENKKQVAGNGSDANNISCHAVQLNWITLCFRWPFTWQKQADILHARIYFENLLSMHGLITMRTILFCQTRGLL